jgi:hypothetical protein
MHIPTEIILLFFIISFLVYTMPSILVNFSRTLQGKALLLILTIVVTLYNRTGGLIMAMFIIFLAEFNYEYNNNVIYEGFTGAETGTDSPTITAINNGISSYNQDYNIIIKKPKQDQLTIEQSLIPIDSSLIDSSKANS